MDLRLWRVISKYFRIQQRIPEWKQFEYFDESWKERIYQMSKYIPATAKKIMDLGCGKMWLRNMLETRIDYMGVDYVKRDDRTIVCDFNKKEFPNKFADVIFVSGCLEYVNEPGWFIENISGHCATCILSYCTLESFPNLSERKQYHWKNHLAKREIISLFHQHSMHNTAFELTDTNYNIFVFTTFNGKA
jgi:hypothetical protein